MEFVIDLQHNELDYIQACVRKERWAQKKLYEDHYSAMMGTCLRYANNSEDALDILHDGFIKVFKHISKYKANTSLGAWIKRIMVNTSIDYYRKRVRRRTEDLDTAYGISSKDPDVVSLISANEILKGLQQLTPSYRSVFNMYVIEGYSHREIGHTLDISESTSRSNLVKARAKLREILKKRGIVYEF